jgi:hypothetical protein
MCPSVNGLFYVDCCPGPPEEYECQCKAPPGGAAICVPKCSKGEPCGNSCCKDDEECVTGQDGQTCKPFCKTHTDRYTSPYYDRATQCCTQHGVQQKYPMGNLEACRPTMKPRPGYTSRPNGCGPAEKNLPDRYKKASFLDACNAHDACYDKCGSSETACNEDFCKALEQSCRSAYPARTSRNRQKCDDMAQTYCDGVRLLGSSYWEDAQKKACQCCP